MKAPRRRKPPDTEEVLKQVLPWSSAHINDHEAGGRPAAGIRFDRTINLSHVLTMASMIGLVTVSWSLMDKRVVVLEEARVAQRDRDMAQDLSSKERQQEVRDALNDLRRSVEKVADRVGAR